MYVPHINQIVISSFTVFQNGRLLLTSVLLSLLDCLCLLYSCLRHYTICHCLLTTCPCIALREYINNGNPTQLYSLEAALKPYLKKYLYIVYPCTSIPCCRMRMGSEYEEEIPYFEDFYDGFQCDRYRKHDFWNVGQYEITIQGGVSQSGSSTGPPLP